MERYKLIVLIGALLLLVGLGQMVAAAPATQSTEPSVPAVVADGGATLYQTPGGEVVRTLTAGIILTAVGRDDRGDWIFVQVDDLSTGWVEASRLIAVGLPTLPLQDAEMVAEQPTVSATTTDPATPSPTPSSTPSPIPSPTVTPQPSAALDRSSWQTTIVRTGGATLMDAPDGAALQEVTVGMLLYAQMRSSDGAWLYVRTTDGTAGWVSSTQVLIARVGELPVDIESPVDSTTPDAEGNGETATSVTSPSDAKTTATIVSPLVTVNTGGQRLNVRDGPGTDYPIIAKANNGDVYPVLARDGSGEWLQLQLGETEEAFGWVSARYVTAADVLDEVSISTAVSAAPAVAPTSTNLSVTSTPVAMATDGTVQAASAPVSAPAVPSGTAGARSGQIVFQESSGGTIYIMNADGTNLRALTTGMDPALSPDGARVAFARWGNAAGIYVIDVDGAGEHQVAKGDRVKYPSWSLDGSHIVYNEQTGSGSDRVFGFPGGPQFVREGQDHWRLQMVDLSDGSREGLSDDYRSFSPSWSSIGVLYAAGGNISVTAPDGESRIIVQGNSTLRNPVLSPDGQTLLATREFHDHWGVVRFNADGSGLARLLERENNEHSVSAAWSPDGSQIVFLTDRTGVWALWIVNADGTDPRPLAPEVLDDIEFQYDFVAEHVVDWR